MTKPFAAIVFAIAVCAHAWAEGLSVPPVGAPQLQAAVQSYSPVTSVNGGKGDVVVPTVQRQVSAALNAQPGTVTWTFPAAFSNMPTCWPSLTATNVNYSFDYPTTTSISRTAVTEQVVAHLNTLAITSLTLPISLPVAVAPPPGTTITLSCVGALP